MRPSVSIKEVQEYWDRQPCNIRHGVSEVGTLAWSQEITSRKYFVEPHIPGFAQFNRWKGKQVLEIGCGLGTDALQFMMYGAKYEGQDLSLESVKLAAKRAELHGFDPWFTHSFVHYNSEMGIAGLLPYSVELPKADLVYSFGVLHHTPHPERILWYANRRLKENGELRIMLYAKISLKNFFKEQPEAQAGCPLAKTYTAWSVKKLLNEAGFEVVSIKKTHIFPWKIREYVNHFYVKRLGYRLMPRFVFKALERLFGWHLLIVAKKVDGKKPYPWQESYA